MIRPASGTVTPEVTVLMGVFNGLPRLETAIASVLNQTFQDFEFLIVDDASTDGSSAVIARWAAQDARIRVVTHANNVGLGAVLRTGLELARGDFVARMDADDESVPERLKKQLEFFRRHPETDVLGSYALDVSRAGVPVRIRRVPTSHEQIVRLVWSCPFIHPTVMFRKAPIERVGGYSSTIRRRQDYDLWFRCVAGGLRLANLAEPLVRYHFSELTLQRNRLRLMWDQVIIGLRGCRLIRAPLHAYIGTCVPLIEALMPRWLRMRTMGLRARLDPRR